MKNKFKISGVGLDTRRLTICPSNSFDELFDYIHTSISENNDYIISDFIKYQSGALLITTIDFSDTMESALTGHLLTIGRNKIDLLLINSNCKWNPDNINQLKTSGIIDSIGISNPDSIDRIIELRNELGNENIKYISLDICPLNFNYDIINWCSENNITILGFNPFGGHISAPSIIDSFSVPYLLGFSATYSSIVFLSGEDIYQCIPERDYLNSLIGKEVEPKYILKKNISKLYKPIKKTIETSLKIGDNIIFPYKCPDTIYDHSDIILNLGKIIETLPEQLEKSNLEEEVYLISDILYKPEDANSSDLFAIYRYRVLELLKVRFPESSWEHVYGKLGDKLMAIVVRKENKTGWIKKKVDVISNTFILGMTSEGKIFFSETN